MTNTSGAASWRGAATRIIGVLMEVLKMDCHGNQDVDVGASSVDPAEWDVLRNRAALVLGIGALHRKVLGQGEVGTREGAKHVDAGVSLLLRHWRLLWFLNKDDVLVDEITVEVRADANSSLKLDKYKIFAYIEIFFKYKNYDKRGILNQL